MTYTFYNRKIFKMLAFITTPLQSTSRLMRGKISSPNALDRSMTTQHACPCCSYVLLRHVRLGRLYWRCSHCHGEMPAWS